MTRFGSWWAESPCFVRTRVQLSSEVKMTARRTFWQTVMAMGGEFAHGLSTARQAALVLVICSSLGLDLALAGLCRRTL